MNPALVLGALGLGMQGYQALKGNKQPQPGQPGGPIDPSLLAAIQAQGNRFGGVQPSFISEANNSAPQLIQQHGYFPMPVMPQAAPPGPPVPNQLWHPGQAQGFGPLMGTETNSGRTGHGFGGNGFGIGYDPAGRPKKRPTGPPMTQEEAQSLLGRLQEFAFGRGPR